ncbi:MAG: CPBP family intramembrane metalloprotease [Lachnospiraceae bacterium]
MKILKKIGSILFCLLPCLLAFAIQMLVTFIGVFLKIIVFVSQNTFQISNLSDPQFLIQLVQDSQFLAGLSAIYAVIAAIVLGFWYWKRFVPKRQPKRKISSIITPQMLIGLIFLMLGMQYISTYLVMLVSVINPAWYDTYQELMEGIGFGNITFILVLYSVLIAPISEEIIFRGITLKYATKAMPFFLANIFQAFLFGIFHGNVVQGTYAFVTGMFCGYVCLKGGSLYLSILFHMLFNIWGTFAPDFLSYSGNSLLLHIVIFAIAVCFTLAGVFLYQKGIDKRTPILDTYNE